MITIGQLASYAGVTVKAVRVYHARGLLPEPPRDASGYRRYTAAGSVIDQDVPPGALGIARARQRNVAGWVAKRRSGTAADDAARRAAQAIETTDHINSADSTKTADSADIED